MDWNYATIKRLREAIPGLGCAAIPGEIRGQLQRPASAYQPGIRSPQLWMQAAI
ncbi:MAG: hypothetical protein GYA55_11000 [SAR324 cluster bacterium]|uniref:Uncharacterized protein n=1 Tax=SAR324 cluster bacterium TaxID=2024889 RepID=A0A7X9FTM9_9DELT|nr:hypothetical protein [SAR324 cluster bacterium]